MCENIIELTQRLYKESGADKKDTVGVGVGCPGVIDSENGEVVFAGNLNLKNFPLTLILGKQLGLPIKITNDANAAALGEAKFGAGKDYKDSVMVTLGTGIGGGIILGGKLWSGINGAAAEFGHMTVDMHGVSCNCGRRGCFEALASANALIAQAQEAMASQPESFLWKLCGGDMQKVEAKTVFDGAAAEDPVSREVLDTYLTYLAEGITNIINIFQPAVLCIGGGVSHAGDALLLPLRERVEKSIYSKNAKINTRIELAKLHNDAGVLGAALLG
jgi:glucokinase